jgi:O-antigen ligase
MTAFAALTGPLPKAGVIVLAALAAASLLARTPRARAGAMAGALVLAPALLLADIWDSPQLRLVHRHPLLAAAGGLAGLAVVAGAGALIARRPSVLALLAVAALPFRIPIEAGHTTSNLLVPLYLVVAAGSLAVIGIGLRAGRDTLDVWGAWGAREARGVLGARGASSARGGLGVPGALGTRGAPGAPAEASAGPPFPGWTGIEPDAGTERRSPGWIERLLAVYVVLYAIQSIYSPDFEKALQQLVFFYVPFALLFVLLRRIDWTPRLVRECFVLVVGLALVFAGIGFAEYETKTIFLNPKLVVANDLHTYFTVNSVFFDPDIFGRFLALAMIGLAVALVFDRRPGEEAAPARRVLAASIALAVLWGGLVLTLSRSSLGALLVGLATLAALRWRASRTLLVAAVVIALGAGAVAIAPKTFGLNQGLNGASSGRADLVTGGAGLFADRPVWGYGAGSFVHEYRVHHPLSATTLSASHTIPITIAAEQGVIGELAYVALVLAVALGLLRGARSDPARAGVAAAFLALVFHTLLYADFLEDPVTWALVAVGCALATRAQSPVTAGAADPGTREVSGPAPEADADAGAAALPA